MTWISVVEVFGATVTAIGGFEGVKWLIKRYFPNNTDKRVVEATTKQTEVGTEKALRDMYEETLKEMREEYVERIKELKSAIAEANKNNTELNKTNTELCKAATKKEELIADKVQKIRELEEYRVRDAKRIGDLMRAIDYYHSWYCEREYGECPEDCKRRKPMQNPPLKHTKLDIKIEGLRMADSDVKEIEYTEIEIEDGKED